MQTPLGYTQTVDAFARKVSLRLLIWSAFSMSGGALLWWRGAPFARAFGIQAVTWGAIDALIAAAGLRPRPQEPPADSAAQAAHVHQAARRAQGLARLLWLNTLLDVGYMAGGLWLARTKGRQDAQWRGHGWGIFVQGAFLFLFDLFHALACRALRPPAAHA
jgi:hypothetical protein